jgi:hypothetical protein
MHRLTRRVETRRSLAMKSDQSTGYCHRVGALCGLAVMNAFLACNFAYADEIVLPAGAVSREHAIDVVYRLASPGNGVGALKIEWTDVLGRVVERRTIILHFAHTITSTFRLDLRRAVVMQNQLRAHLSFKGIAATGALDLRESDTQVSFSAQPTDYSWWDYQVIMWQPRTAPQYATLKRLGITAGMVLANHGEQTADYVDKQIAPLLASNLRWYVENIATDFYSAYHKWSPNNPENWRFLEAKRRYKDDPSNLSSFMRDPSLSDPNWLKRIHDRLVATVRSQLPYRPLYYSLGDETGIADLSAYWDFDLSPDSLAGMRDWLRQRYPSLAALNAQWGSHFHSWGQVVPMTTSEAFRRADDNYSAWADFKEWMDVAFARALRSGTDAVHATDPNALAAIEGAQIPGWGGYDYSRLATVVDAMELYDYGNNIDIVRSLNPKLVVLTTSSGGGPEEAHQVWRELLRGARGLILWDPGSTIVGADGTLAPSEQRFASDLKEIRDGLGALLIGSTLQKDPVGILYSPASQRTQWLLDQKPKGGLWTERNAESEYENNAVRAATRAYAKELESLGIQYRFISSDMVHQGVLSSSRYKLLMLPRTISLSRTESRAIRQFVRSGGTLVADSEPGTFDEHSRSLAKPLLADIIGTPPPVAGTRIDFGRGTVNYIPLAPGDIGSDPNACVEHASLMRMAELIRAGSIEPAFSVTGFTNEIPTDVRTYVFRDGDVTILALLRDLCKARTATEADLHDVSETVRLNLPRRSFAYDIRRGKSLGHVDNLELALDPSEPTILALSNSPMPTMAVSAPRMVRGGQTAGLRIRLTGAADRAVHVLHVETTDPSGNVVHYYTCNLVAVRGSATLRLPFALGDAVGPWKIRITDLLSGSTTATEIQVRAQ